MRKTICLGLILGALAFYLAGCLEATANNIGPGEGCMVSVGGQTALGNALLAAGQGAETMAMMDARKNALPTAGCSATYSSLALFNSDYLSVVHTYPSAAPTPVIINPGPPPSIVH